MRPQQHFPSAHGQVAMDQAEQHQPHAVTDVEPIQAFHIVISLEIRRATCFIAVSSCPSVGLNLRVEERVRQMHATEEHDDRSTRANQDSRDHSSSPCRLTCDGESLNLLAFSQNDMAWYALPKNIEKEI